MSLRNYSTQHIFNNDIEAVVDTLKSDYITSGPKVKEFESKICKLVDAKYGIAVNSATSGLDLAIKSLNLEEGSEILVPAFTFVASANCILYNNHIPVFVDINKDDYTIDVDSIESKITSKTKAIICVDFAGHPCNVNKLKEICEKYNLYLIQDASHSLGSSYDGKMIGSIADITVFSFHAVKPITTGEGGMVVTNNEVIANHCRMLRSHGIDKTPEQRKTWEYDMIDLGHNYRMTEFQAALGISQLKGLNYLHTRREILYDEYNYRLHRIQNIKIPSYKRGIIHAYHIYCILLKDKKERDYIYTKLKEEGIGVNVHYIPIYHFTYYKKLGYNIHLPNTEDVYSRILTLPLHSKLHEKDITIVVRLIKKLLKSYREGLL